MAKILDPQDLLKAVAKVIGENRAEMRGELDLAIKQMGDDGHTDLVRSSMRTMGTHLHEQKQLLVSVRRSLDTLGRGPGKAPMSARTVLIRSIIAKLFATKTNNDPVAVAEEMFKSTRITEAVKNPASLAKAVTSPAMTSVTGWAAELMNDRIYPGALATLAPTSVYAGLKRRGIEVSLAGISSMRFPGRAQPGSAPPNPFIGEGRPLPVRQFSLSGGGMLTGHKCGALSMFTGEIARASTPSIEASIRTLLDEDISIGIDAVLLGNDAATAIQPAGLLDGITGLTHSAETDPALAAVADLTALAGAIDPAPAQLVYVMNPVQAVSSGLLLTGVAGLDVITSVTVPAKTVIAIDAADFVSSADNGETSVEGDSAVVMDDEPAAGDMMAQSPITSMFQTDAYSVRVLEDVSWALRRPGRVAYVDNVTW